MSIERRFANGWDAIADMPRRTAGLRSSEFAAPAIADRRRRLFLLAPLIALLPRAAGAGPALIPTPRQALGPFYPLRPDPTAGSDLVVADGQERTAGKPQGTPLAVVGRVLDTGGRPQPGVLLEIWQTNAHGRYHHPHDDSPQPLDPRFRGYGRATTGADGGYRFVTIEPVAYPGRTPHVHFRLSRAGRELLVTQMYLPAPAGAGNDRDGLFMSVREPAVRRLLLAMRDPETPGTLRFDIVLEAAR